MVFVPAPGTIKAELVYTLENSYMENVLNYDVGTSVAEINLTELAAALKTCWDTYLKSETCSNMALAKIRCTSLDAQDAPGIEYVTGLPISGTNAGATLPANCALEVILYTDLRGRSNRGRLFYPGLPEGSASGSVWAGGAITGWTTAFGHLLHMTGGSTTADLTVVSRMHNGLWRDEAETNAVTRIGLSPYVASQRRRLPGRGM